jgi:hypothetical protein
MRMLTLAMAALLSCCTPADPEVSARIEKLEKQVAELKASSAPSENAGALSSYTFEMSADATSVAMADEGEVPVLINLESVIPQGDSQAVKVTITNPSSLQLRTLQFKASWRSRNSESIAGSRQVEWSGEIDPGYKSNVSFVIGPLPSQDLGAVTIAEVRPRWAARRKT